MNTDHLRRAQASYEEEIAAMWRDWCAYLRAQLALIEARAATLPGFDTEDSAASRAAAARQRIALLPPEHTALFEAVFAERREQAQRDHERQQRDQGGRAAHIADPDASDAALLQRLLAEADGRSGSDPGWGLVPLGTPDAVQWFQVDVSSLNGAPDDAAYALGAAIHERRKRRRAAAGGFGCVLLLGLFWLTIPDATTSASTRGAPQINGQSAQPWAVSAATLSSSGAAVTLPLQPVSALPWPAAAAWLRGSAAPTEICLPATQLAGLRGVQLSGEPGTPLREYVVADGPADLRIAACDGDAPARTAQLRASSAPPAHKLGAPVALAEDLRVTVLAAQRSDAAESAEVPAGSALLTLRVRGLPAEPRRLAPSLRTPAGAALQPLSVEATETETALRYLLPDGLPPTVLWTLTHAGQEHRWEIAVPAAPDNGALLAAAISAPPRAQRAADGTLTITVTLHNRAATALALSPADLALIQGDARLSPEIQGAAPIAPGDKANITITTLAAPGLPLVLHVGAVSYQLE